MKYYSYFPGCSTESTGLGLGLSAQAIAKPLDMELIELEDWNCCGSTPYGSLDEEESIVVAARNLALAEKRGLDLVTPCSACYVTLAKANRQAGEAIVGGARGAANRSVDWVRGREPAEAPSGRRAA